MGNQVDGRFDRRSSVNWRWKNDPHLIGDHLPILISDQANWSLIGGGKTGPKLDLQNTLWYRPYG